MGAVVEIGDNTELVCAREVFERRARRAPAIAVGPPQPFVEGGVIKRDLHQHHVNARQALLC